MPRPTKLTDKVIEDMANMIAATVPVDAACRALGIGRRTYTEWIARGRNPGPGDALYVELVERLDAAVGIGVVAAVQRVTTHALRDSKSAAYLLERAERPRDDLGRFAVQSANSATVPIVRFEIHLADEEVSDVASDRAVDAGADGPAEPAEGRVVDDGLGQSERVPAVVIDVQGEAVA